MFQPELSLFPAADGTFTLLVKALVPNSCYVAGTIKPGSPSGIITIPEAQPFTFTIDHHHGICAQFVHHVYASISGLRPSAGHSSLIVFGVVDGHVSGQAAVSFPPADHANMLSAGGVSPGSIVPGTASATVSSDLIGPAVFRAMCLVATSTLGYTTSLAPAVPQGINPSFLLLKLSLTPPRGPVIQMPSTALCRYEVRPYTGRYSDVTILNGAQSVTVPVITIFSAFDPARKFEFGTVDGGG